MAGPLLQVEDLHVSYLTERGPLHAVSAVTFSVAAGERFGIVGESGCGKSTTAMAILRLLKPPARVDTGRVLLNGVDLFALSEEDMRRRRWRDVSLVMQGAMNSLNPVTGVRKQLADVIMTHEGKASSVGLDRRIAELLRTVGLREQTADRFPHELSGEMKQRVCIAMAIVLRPKLIIADEPTSALDVVMQRVVIQTLIEVQERLGAALVLIGHDMGLQAQIVQRIGVMYAGRMVEIAPIDQIFREPLHPYTQALIQAIPSIIERKLPRGVPGLPPSLLQPPPGCPFAPRCPHAFDPCRQILPQLLERQSAHATACHLYSSQNEMRQHVE